MRSVKGHRLLAIMKSSPAYPNRTFSVFSCIYRTWSGRNMKLWLLRSFMAACVCFIYWNLLGLISSGDWSTFLRATEVSWIVNDTAEEEVPACSLRHIIKKENSLKKHFSFLVPVLQWRDSFIHSHWVKLQNEPLPYGWKNQSYHEISKTLSLLSHPGNSHLFERKTPDKCVRCAVVGNGGILNGSMQGKFIDSHDYVFRVNGAIIKGFENDVGTKTSFYGFTTNSLKNSLVGYYEDGFDRVPRDPGIGYIFIPAETRDYTMVASAIQGVSVPSGPDKGDSPSELFGYNPEIHQFKMIHPSFIQYVTQRFLKSPQLDEFRDLYMPSTGALMLLAALHTCDQVSAYGFITDNYENFSDHYYDKVMKPLILFANHDMIMEGQLWKQLHSHKVLWLYQRNVYKKLMSLQ